MGKILIFSILYSFLVQLGAGEGRYGRLVVTGTSAGGWGDYVFLETAGVEAA